MLKGKVFAQTLLGEWTQDTNTAIYSGSPLGETESFKLTLLIIIMWQSACGYQKGSQGEAVECFHNSHTSYVKPVSLSEDTVSNRGTQGNMNMVAKIF